MAQDLFSQLALQTLSEISAADSPASSASTGQTGQAQASQSAPSPTRSPKMVISPFMVDAIASEEGLTDTQKQVMTALLNQESNYGRNARTSTDGARGVGQIMPATFQRYARPGERIDDPAHNLAVMSRIVKDAGSKFGDDPAKIATAYFSGDGNVNRGQGSAWKADRADGNGKRVSSYVSDIVSRMGVAPRQSEQPQEWDQGARYAPVGLAYQVTKEPRPAEKPSKRAGFWEGAADVGLSTAQGVVGSVKALTDLAGADNMASRGLDDASKGLEKLKSDASQADRQYHQQKIKEAEASGDWKDEVAAYANMVWDMPLESLAQGVGSFATLGAGKVAQMAKLASAAKKAGVAKEAFLKTAQGIEAARKASDLGMKVNVGLGVGQGIGGVKGSQYEQTFNAAKESGLSDEQAKTLATEAQSYQQGWGQQALGAGLGYVAGKTGPIEKLAAGKTVGAGGVARRFVGGGLVEAGTEGLQGGQERYAGNAAAIDAGVLDPSMQWAGVAGSGASEAITAGVLGGGAGALGRPDVDPQAQARAAAQQSGGIVSRAGLAATPGAQPPAQPGANPSTPPNPGTPPAGGPTGANGAQPPAQPGAGQQAPGQPSAGQPVAGANPAAPGQAGPRAKQPGSTANPFVGLFDTDEVYGKWSNLRDGSDRDSMRQLMTDVFKLYANANLSPYDPASLKYELQQGYKWFRLASPQQQDAGVAAIFAAAGKQPAVSTPSAKPGQAPAAPANPIQASAQSAIEQALVEDKARRRAAGEVVEDDDEVTDVEVKPASAERDPMLDQAVEFVKQSGKPSINAVQRQFKIGYNRAARLLEDMERDGIVGPLQADGLRQVLKPAAPPAAAPAPQQPASAGFSLPAFDNSPIPKTDPAAAEEQRRQAAEFEQKRKVRRAAIRASVWERNPMLAFLGANGISRDVANEFAPGLVERRKAFVPGYGPVFRPGAKNLDELVQTAKEDGFLREDDGEPELYDLIDRALRGERIAPLYADGVAEAEGQRRLQAMQERDGADFEDYLQQAEAEDFDPFPLMADSGYDEQDLAGTDFDQADDAARAEVAALAAQYADLGFDPADVLEALAIENENQPEQTYYDRARTRLTDLISQAYAQAQPQGSGAVRADRAEPLPSGEAGARGPAAGQQVRPAAPTPKLRNVDELAAEGFNRVVKQGGKTYFVNPDTRESVELDSPAQIARARARVQAKQRLGSLRGTRPQPFGLDAVTPKALKARDEQAQAAQAQQTAEQQAAANKAKADDERRRIEQASYAAASNFELGQNPLDSLTGQQDIFSTAPVDVRAIAKDMRETQAYWDGLHQRADKLDDPAVKDAQSKFESGEIDAPEFDAAIAAAEQRRTRVAQDLAGERINGEWVAFDPQSGTLGIPRAQMPQIKAEHRGAMVNFLKARGIDGQQETIPSAAIKPTQAEFSPAKVKQAMDYQGGNRSIIVSADGYVVDGHHQWLAAREKGEPIPAIRLDQNIGDVLAALKDMPSAQPERGAKAESVAGLPDGARLETGAKGQAKGKVRYVDGNGEALGNWSDTEAEALADARKNQATKGSNAEAAQRFQQAVDRVRRKALAGDTLTDNDLESIGINPDGSEFPYMSSALQRLFGIQPRNVREAMGDAIRKGQGMYGGDKEFVPSPRRAIANAVQWMSSQPGMLYEQRNADRISRAKAADTQEAWDAITAAAPAQTAIKKPTKKQAEKLFSGEALEQAKKKVKPNADAFNKFKREGSEREFQALLEKYQKRQETPLSDDEIDRFIDLRTARNQAIYATENAGAEVDYSPEENPGAQPEQADADDFAGQPGMLYEQRNADRISRAKAADTQEAWDAITAEENADPERHFEGTDALRRAINGRRLDLKPDNGSFAIYPDRQQDDETAATDSQYPLVTHTTKKGKVLRGYIVHGMTLDEVKASIDPYALKKDVGVFVREQHKDKLPKPATSSSGRGPAASQAWKDEGKSPADLIAEKAQSVGRELAVQVAEESREQDFRPSEIPQAVEQWAADASVPADDLKRVLLQELPSLGVSEARIQQIRAALYPASKPATRDPSAGRAAAGGQVGVNGYFYKGGQFLPTTMAEPGKWKLDGKWVTSGREEVAPREWGHAPTPFSRSIYAMINAWTDLKDGKLSVRDGIRDYQGNPVTPDTEIRPGVRGVQGQQALTLQELIDAWNAGQRWFDVQPNAKTITTQEQTAAEPVQQDSQAAAGQQGIITADDVAAAEKQVAQMIEARIDGMKAADVQRIAARFLPTVGVRVPVGKAKIKAAMTDTTAMNLLGPAGELGIELSESVKRALVAKMEGRVGVTEQSNASQPQVKPAMLPPGITIRANLQPGSFTVSKDGKVIGGFDLVPGQPPRLNGRHGDAFREELQAAANYRATQEGQEQADSPASSNAIPTNGMTQAEAQQALESGQKLLHDGEEVWVDRVQSGAVDTYVIKRRDPDSSVVMTKGPAGPRGVQWGKQEAARKAVETMGLPQERQPTSATPDDDANENIKRLSELKQDLQALQQRIKDQGRVADDRLLQRERKLADVIKELEQDIQKAKIDQIPAASVPDEVRDKALEAGQARASRIFDWVSKASGVAQVKSAVMDSLMGQGYFDDGAITLANQIVEELRQRSAKANNQPAGREGYDTPVELDAAQLKTILEQTRGEPLVNKPAKLEAWRNGAAKTDPAKFPIELFLTTDGRLDVNDGRHRIALAAERGEKVTAFIDGKDVQRVQALLEAANNPGVEYVDRMMAEAQQRLDTLRANQAKAGTNAWTWDKKIAEAEQAVATYQKVRDSMTGGNGAQSVSLKGKAAGDVLAMGNGTLYRIEGIDVARNFIRLVRNPDMLSERIVSMGQDDYDRLLADDEQTRQEMLEQSQSPAIQDFISGKQGTPPTLEQVQSKILAKLEHEIADWQVRRDLPINQAQTGLIDAEIAKLQAQVEALRGATGQEDELDAEMQGYERKAQAEEAARYLKDFVYSLGNLDGMTDRAQVLLSSPLGKSGRDTLLMKAFGLTREEAHDINNRLDSREPNKLRNVDMQEAFAMFPGLREMVDEAIQKVAGKQPAVTVDADLEAIFDQLDGLTQRTQADGQRAAAAHPKAERIQFVQKHILDILQDLEDSGKVSINC